MVISCLRANIYNPCKPLLHTDAFQRAIMHLLTLNALSDLIFYKRCYGPFLSIMPENSLTKKHQMTPKCVT